MVLSSAYLPNNLFQPAATPAPPVLGRPARVQPVPLRTKDRFREARASVTLAILTQAPRYVQVGIYFIYWVYVTNYLKMNLPQVKI